MTPSPNDAGIGLYVITLVSSDLPMSLDVPFRHELVGFTVFRSRSFEHGRERFSLHVGYFESERRAEDALTVVCRHYPQAWIAAAPATNLSSLDNTLNTEFRLLRTAYARVVTPKRATGVEAPTFAAGNRTPVPAVPSSQHYAVQLTWSLVAIVAVDVPRLAIFKAYHLYTVRVPRGGFPQHGLRLGFFDSADEARQVAEYVRPKFLGVGVVPVSHREYSRAIELARQRALKVATRGEAPGVSAVTRESEVRVTPSTTEPMLSSAPSPAPGLVSPVQSALAGEDLPSRPGK